MTMCIAFGPQAAAKSELYFVDSLERTIERGNLDGSNVEVVTNPLSSPTIIAIDIVGEKLY